MGDLTTPDRVRRAIGYSDPALTDQALQEFIDDTEAFIVKTTARTFAPADGNDYVLAKAACTLGAAIRAIIIPLGGTVEGLDYRVDEVSFGKSKQLDARLSTAAQYRIDANAYLKSLIADDTSVPFSNTQAYG